MRWQGVLAALIATVLVWGRPPSMATTIFRESWATLETNTGISAVAVQDFTPHGATARDGSYVYVGSSEGTKIVSSGGRNVLTTNGAGNWVNSGVYFDRIGTVVGGSTYTSWFNAQGPIVVYADYDITTASLAAGVFTPLIQLHKTIGSMPLTLSMDFSSSPTLAVEIDALQWNTSNISDNSTTIAAATIENKRIRFKIALTCGTVLTVDGGGAIDTVADDGTLVVTMIDLDSLVETTLYNFSGLSLYFTYKGQALGGGELVPANNHLSGASVGYAGLIGDNEQFVIEAEAVMRPIPIRATAAPLTPCDPQTQVGNGDKGNAGCNTGGVGWVSSYSGPYGAPPIYPDPVDGETLTGKRDLDLWVDLVHTDYPSAVVTTYRHALTDLADAPTYEGGRKTGRLLSLGSVGHGLSNEQGGFSASSVDLAFSDAADRHFRTLLNTQDLEGDELRVKLASPAARAAGSPPRILQRATVQKSPTTSPLTAGITAVDALFAEFGPFGPDREFPTHKIPDVWLNTPQASLDLYVPILYGEKSDEGAVDPETNDPASKGLIPLIYVGQEDLGSDSVQPPAIVEDTSLPEVVPTSVTNAAFQGGDIKVSTYIFTAGVTSDGTIGPVHAWPEFDPLGVTEADGVALAIHLVRDDAFVSFIAWAGDDPAYNPISNPDVGNVGTGTHDNSTRDAFYDDGSDFTLLIKSLNNAGRVTASNTVWDAYLVHLGAGFEILNLYGSDLGGGLTTNTHDRTLIDTAARGGSDVLGPDWPNWPFAERYRAYTDADGTVWWFTMIYARGPLSDDHKNGVVNMTVNALGAEDVGDGTGLPLIDAHAVQQHWIDNHLLGSYTSGLWVTAADNPEWEDGTAKVRSTSFADAQTFSISKIGNRGLTVGWYVESPASLSQWIKEWNDSTETRLGVNGHGQFMLGWIDELATTTAWPRVDHVPQLFGTISRSPGEERENVVSGQCDYDPDASRFRSEPVTVTSTAGITKYKNRRKPGDPLQSHILNDTDQLTWVLQRRLWRLQYGSTTVKVTGGLDLLDTDVGDGILLTSIEGPGASGYVDTPMLILWRETAINDRLTTYTLLELNSTLIPLAEQFVVSNGASSVGLLTSTGFLVGA